MRVLRYLARLSSCLTIISLTCGQVNAQVQAYLDYDPASGNLAFDTVSITDATTTLELQSNAQFLLSANPQGLDGAVRCLYSGQNI